MVVTRGMKRPLEDTTLPPRKRMRESTDSKLWALPRELRDIIYDYAISSDFSKHYKTVSDDLPRCLDLSTLQPSSTLPVCKRLRHEYQDALIRRLKQECWYIPFFFDTRGLALEQDFVTRAKKYPSRSIRPWLRSLSGLFNAKGLIMSATPTFPVAPGLDVTGRTATTREFGPKFVSSLKVENTIVIVQGTPMSDREVDHANQQLFAELRRLDVWNRGKGPTLGRILNWAKTWQHDRLQEIRQMEVRGVRSYRAWFGRISGGQPPSEKIEAPMRQEGRWEREVRALGGSAK